MSKLYTSGEFGCYARQRSTANRLLLHRLLRGRCRLYADFTSEINFHILYPLNDFIQHVFIQMTDSKPDNRTLGARLALDERAADIIGG